MGEADQRVCLPSFCVQARPSSRITKSSAGLRLVAITKETRVEMMGMNKYKKVSDSEKQSDWIVPVMKSHGVLDKSIDNRYSKSVVWLGR